MSGSNSDFDISQALADLAKGEMTASALENNLSTIEGKVDELLALFERQEAALGATTETEPQNIENETSCTSHDQTEELNSPSK
ncbi:uncharacterized protein N7511_009751 [Penicillium nucicola]|uniref:uncharacterized protein n=1 Tax=Penicillium nucicola TaxID=1850975 RepID=UPI002545405D|nr:uncharacterized protein N7511_009751 [Penicillium nucicola]KAJ5748055.1 hypothetical protein N7511_009751 [Penicillium nucicola]